MAFGISAYAMGKNLAFFDYVVYAYWNYDLIFAVRKGISLFEGGISFLISFKGVFVFFITIAPEALSCACFKFFGYITSLLVRSYLSFSAKYI